MQTPHRHPDRVRPIRKIRNWFRGATTKAGDGIRACRAAAATVSSRRASGPPAAPLRTLVPWGSLLKRPRSGHTAETLTLQQLPTAALLSCPQSALLSAAPMALFRAFLLSESSADSLAPASSPQRIHTFAGLKIDLMTVITVTREDAQRAVEHAKEAHQRAVEHAKEAHQRAEDAHRTAAELHKKSAALYDRAAAIHERAHADHIGDETVHRQAAQQYREAARSARAAAEIHQDRADSQRVATRSR
jgi:hypothetical protein